jgi:phage terminase large subunit
MLENLPEELRRAWLDGDWNVFAGQYFSEFREDVHVIDPFPIPDHWNRYFTCDYGLDMFAGLWIARDPQGNAYVYKEVHEPELIITEAVKRYQELNGEDKVKIRYAPPDLWNRRNDTGRSAADIFQQQGLILTKYDNNRVLGWYNIKEWLQVIESRDEQTGEPIKTSRLKIMRSCPTLIKHLPLMQRDPKNPNDCLNEPHYITHICDGLRGFCISWTVPGKELPEPKTEHDRYVEKVLNTRKKSRQKLV